MSEDLSNRWLAIVDGLNAKVAELIAERDRLKVTSEAAMEQLEEQGAYVDELRAEIGKLKRERISDKHELGKYIRERDAAERKLAAAEEEAMVAREALAFIDRAMFVARSSTHLYVSLEWLELHTSPSLRAALRKGDKPQQQTTLTAQEQIEGLRKGGLP